jgi:ribosomal protein L16 Arg81 hydroxylase
METVNFASLITPLSKQDFFKHYWEKSFFHTKHQQDDYFSKILSIADIDNFLSKQNLQSDGIRLMQTGKEIIPRYWTKSEPLLDGTIRTSVNPDKVFNFFNKGATIILNSAEKMIPALENACRTIEQELKIRVQSNIYITPPGSQGFAIHYDPHDIFLMQIKGPKTWRIYDSEEELPTTYRKFKKEPLLITQFEINSGDFLYIPRGTPHEAFSSEVSTIHVNFSLKPRYGFHLLEDLAKIAEKEDVFFRYTIPNGLSSNDERKQYAILFKQKLMALIERTSPEDLLKKQEENFNAKQLFALQGRLKDILAIEQLNIDSIISRRKGFDFSIISSEVDTKILYGEQELSIPHFLEKDIFLSELPFKVKDIKGLITTNGKLAIVRKFLESGFLKFDELE